MLMSSENELIVYPNKNCLVGVGPEEKVNVTLIIVWILSDVIVDECLISLNSTSIFSISRKSVIDEIER